MAKRRNIQHDHHQEGWRLLQGASGYAPSGAPATSLIIDREVAQVAAPVDAWDEPNFGIIGATLKRSFRPQHDFVFAGGLKAESGPKSLLSVGTMLDRLDALDKGTKADGRKATRKEDHEALKLLAERCVTPEERTRLRQLVQTASRAPQVDAVAPATKSEDGGAQSIRNSVSR